MMRWNDAKRLACTLCLVMTAQAGAAELEWQSVLEAPNAPKVVDAMAPEPRRMIVRQLVDAMESDPENLDIPKLLCAIHPWTTVDPDIDDAGTDLALQMRVWQQMAQLDPQSKRFRWLDCVAANMIDGYRDSALSPLYDLRQSYCTGVPISKDMPAYLTRVQRGIRTFNSRVRRGMARAVEQAKTPERRSYYPMRNETRLATLGAAKAVALANAGDMPAARAEFAAVADRLGKSLDQADFAATRTGWTLYSDLEFFRAFYDWLGRGDGRLDFSRFVNWPAALEDPAIANAIPASTRQSIKDGGDPDYVDPILVERLLPGAARGKAECDSWRRRSLHTRELAVQIQTCANQAGGVPQDAAALSNLDACIHRYQASDWRVQFAAVNPSRVDDGIREARGLVEDLMSSPRFLGLPRDQQQRIARNLGEVGAEPYSDRYTRIVTRNDLRTEDRTALEQVFDDLKLSNRPLMARKPIY